MHPNINMTRLRADSKDLAAECRQYKERLGERWTEPMGDIQRALARTRRRLTELHVFGASLRGRYHVVRAPRGASETWTAEAHRQAIAERVLREYVLEARAEASPA